MDAHLRQLFNEAIALDDKAREDWAAWEATRAERAQAPRSHLVYKVYEPKVAAQQQGTAPMVDAVDAAWVQTRLENFADVIGAEVGKTQTEIVRILREEIASLRAELESLKPKNLKPDGLEGSSVTMMRKQNAV